jgi:hypothetical protein
MMLKPQMLMAIRRVASIVVGIVTVVVIAGHYATSGIPEGKYGWVDYGMIILSSYIIITYLLILPMRLPQATLYPGKGTATDILRGIVLLVGIFLYIWIVHNLFMA